MDKRKLDALVAARSLAASGRARELRHAAQLTQRELADLVGVGQGAVSRWERGERVPRTEAAVRYGRALIGIEGAL